MLKIFFLKFYFSFSFQVSPHLTSSPHHDLGFTVQGNVKPPTELSRHLLITKRFRFDSLKQKAAIFIPEKNAFLKHEEDLNAQDK